MASLQEIRARFPAMERRVEGQSVAYFDGPGGTQVPQTVVEAVADYLIHHNANAHWAFPTSEETDLVIAQARAALADFLNATPSEIAFGANMTTLTFHLARALGRGLGPGDEVVVTELDHHANVAPWQALVVERGVTLRTVAVRPESGELDWADLTSKLNRRTKVLAIGAASNALGTINDVAAATRLAHDVGATVFVDAVHYAPHRLVDVRAWDCDYLACSAYKFYGPHVGVLFGKHELLQSLDLPKLEPAPNSSPERLETGTQNHEGIAGAAAAVDFLASLADGPTRRARLQTVFDALHEAGSDLIGELWRDLSAIPGIRLFGPGPAVARTPTISFAVPGVPAREVCRQLAGKGLFASHGNFYAQTVVERLGQSRDGLVRIGCACYTEPREIQRLIVAVRELCG
ncbi:cysteine desulfurase-like protein [Singulisphaera sp. GP187]|uniref:cysteine desulfurase-like protein n=1 Tax=Singulisphaera sp. GP187 TaxID=1882752 RepID=UPI001C1F889D|nr:cysteine desulfurase-like protein [Singulisphaera sp. GP187]